MMNASRQFLLAGLLILFGLFFGGTAVYAQSDDVFGELCSKTPNATVCQEKDKSQDPECNSIYGECGILTKVARILATVVGIVSVVVIIIGGMRYVLASGDPSKVNSAKSTIIFAIAGLAVSVLAQAIVVFVLNKI